MDASEIESVTLWLECHRLGDEEVNTVGTFQPAPSIFGHDRPVTWEEIEDMEDGIDLTSQFFASGKSFYEFTHDQTSVLESCFLHSDPRPVQLHIQILPFGPHETRAVGSYTNTYLIPAR